METQKEDVKLYDEVKIKKWGKKKNWKKQAKFMMKEIEILNNKYTLILSGKIKGETI